MTHSKAVAVRPSEGDIELETAPIVANKRDNWEVRLGLGGLYFRVYYRRYASVDLIRQRWDGSKRGIGKPTEEKLVRMREKILQAVAREEAKPDRAYERRRRKSKVVSEARAILENGDE
jgi:hypothetical protein